MKKIISVILSLVLALSALSALSLCSFAANGVEVVTRVGDVNADKKISIIDARWILMYIAGTKNFGSTQQKVADANQDGKISIADARRVLQHIAGTKELPTDVFGGDGWIDI